MDPITIAANEREYADIINLEHHTSKKYPPVPGEVRAGQFAPFSALDGFEDAIDATDINTWV